ncbi:pyrroline-5-carboxylate reductase [Shewanella sp. JNE10-2]|uniref:pyrroline-5-carboxylate reductase n=1 Tax=Shewanella TaxID=22 RepID=UPI0020054B08|nr:MULTISPECIES: pyrroline-5-carboxylate reductase [Shewanella]MCK7629623.1 pyrroline-5-carboxylate reductase [Shewanella sp. JNE9-1]MCK7632931.1 pyrroline-5-carboxylate reductase [Shewanella sp. JNE17]MCK7644793.1 pyrroline-5-carboxylate reductase [Shewanella sp. JNE3-1]MCK7647567.1 pyrroline-5-carboxylate reductase [Shewanella sp. JNE8]MCK7652926.1 pyrroline-5-carboxylate reductase [Shewanella sp. JNE4-1]
MEQQKICFIGAGNMTRSIISGLIHSGYPAKLIQATNPSQGKLDALQTDFGVLVSQDNLSSAQNADVIVLSVKPQLMQQVCEALQAIDMSKKLVITIAAGVKAQRYSDYLAQDITLIRAMPNTPMQIGVGMTGLYAPQAISTDQKAICDRLMSSGGEIVWVNEEAELDQVIALSGSSPAYFFLLMESMIDAGKQMGIDEYKARMLVQQAALGAAMMAKQNPELDLGQLRENVTSKGGTTAQAIATFEAANMRGLVKKAMENCINRAEEMAKTF